MKSFPLFLSMVGARVVILGGGEAAAQKARLIGRTEADIVLMAPELEPELAALVADRRAIHVPAVLEAEALRGARLALVCTGCAGADAAAAAVARALGVLVNVVDRPALCDVTMPAIVDRDPLVVAIGTEGAAPVLARQVKTRLEALLEPRLGGFVALAARLRERVAMRVAKDRRRAFWEWAFEGPRRLFTRGDEAAAVAAIDAALETGGAPEGGDGRVALLDPGPGEPDLMSLRAVQRLQSADLVIYAADAAPILELARRDAERHALGPGDGVAQAAALAVEMASGGGAVVILHPATVALAEVLASHGRPAELVPGPKPHSAPRALGLSARP